MTISDFQKVSSGCNNLIEILDEILTELRNKSIICLTNHNLISLKQQLIRERRKLNGIKVNTGISEH